MDYTTDCTTASSPFDEALSRPFLDSSDNYDDEDYSDGEEYGEQREAVTTKKWSLSKPSSWFRRSSSSSSKNDRNNNKALSSSSFKMTDLSKLPIDVVDDCESTSVTSDATLEEDDLISYAKKPTNIKSNQRRRSFDTMTTANSSGIFTTGTTTTNGRPESVSRVSSTSTTSTIMTCTLSHPLQDLMELDYDDDDDNRETTSLIQRQNEVVVFDMEAGTTLDPDTEIMKERQTELGNLAGSMRQIRDIQLDLSLIVDSHEEQVKRLSWESIEAFEHAQSGMENLVQTVKYQQDRKSKMYSFLSSLIILMVVCYVVASFFNTVDVENNPGDNDYDATPEMVHEAVQAHYAHGGSPKFLTPP